MRQLIHNGVVVPPRPEYHRLQLMVRGQSVTLTPEQEEMALAWARKLGTEYVDDATFARNFLADFSAALGLSKAVTLDDVDFGPAADIVAAERAAREALTKEERKALAAERKVAREALREQYGYATVDGARTELGTYLVEPSGIFMGRGKHPLRGKWKEGPQKRDITLNLSPDAPRPEGNWAEIVWQPESMWIARWNDKLSEKVKYIWLADTAPVKQNKEQGKFDKATALDANIEQVRAHIEANLSAGQPRRRMVATACYLIDKLCLRVGDEKDPDEADTVGATTLRPEHITLHEDGTAEFKFLGKDSVQWHKKVELPEIVRQNLVELIRDARPSRNGNSAAGNKPQLFPDIGSRDVNAFLNQMQKGLSAKVFRTFHATAAVRGSLEDANVTAEDAEYKKREAVVQANLAAALLCNHYKKAPASWAERRVRQQERKAELQELAIKARAERDELREALKALRAENRARAEAASTAKQKERAKASGQRKIASAENKVAAAERKLRRAEETLAKFSSQAILASKSRTWNLGTSLKSYIDPRVYYCWGQQVDYDVLATYYPKTLQKKFAWVRAGETCESGADETAEE